MSILTDNNRLTICCPQIAGEWNYKKNSPMLPEDFSYGSERVVWWLCSKCGNEWEAVINYRTTKLAGRCLRCNSLAVKNPELITEWHPTKNGNLTPYDILPGQAIMIWWKCKICECEWKTNAYNRTSPNKKCGCPSCKHKRANASNSLAVLNPVLAKEWHPTKNKGLTPFDFTVNSHKNVWWKCNICGYEWQEVINNRNMRRNKCFRCRSLAVKNPDLAKEWDYIKNKRLTPYDITVSSNKRVHWICPFCKHKWKTSPSRRNHCNCPVCNKVVLNNGAVCDSIPEAYIYLKYKELNIKFHHNKKYGKKLGERKYDFYLPSENKYVEVTSFNKNNHRGSWFSYLRNIATKKSYVKNVLKAEFQFIQFIPSADQIRFVRRNMKVAELTPTTFPDNKSSLSV